MEGKSSNHQLIKQKRGSTPLELGVPMLFF